MTTTEPTEEPTEWSPVPCSGVRQFPDVSIPPALVSQLSTTLMVLPIKPVGGYRSVSASWSAAGGTTVSVSISVKEASENGDE
jgi:hypothetical protein